MVERGDATPEDVDQAMELGAGYRMSFSCLRLSPLPFIWSTLFTSRTL
jgi:3-hydroxyacyl-CoA dehydrogenase